MNYWKPSCHECFHVDVFQKTCDFGKKKWVWGGFKLSISMAEIETPGDWFFWSEAIGIRKSLPTTKHLAKHHGWPPLLLFVARRWTIGGGFLRDSQKIDCKNAKGMFYENVSGYQCQFSHGNKSIFWDLQRDQDSCCHVFVCLQKQRSQNSCTLTFFTRLYTTLLPSQTKMWANSPNHLQKRSQGALWIGKFSWPKSSEYFGCCCSGIQLVGRFWSRKPFSDLGFL